tara:strand:- start:401 stop:790 length:390 start_codon:yes stop_codon:yes gene_type:complete
VIYLLFIYLIFQPTSSSDGVVRSNSLVDAVMYVESRNNPNAWNKREDACGVLQIRPIMIKDVNRILKRNQYTLNDRWNKTKSIEIFYIIQEYYSPNGTPERIARVWNGGPNGYKKQQTLAYWHKVKQQL